MYTPLPYKATAPIQTKVQAIRYIKKQNKRYAKWANNTNTVKYIMNKHLVYATIEFKVGIYVEVPSGYADIINIGNVLQDVDQYPKLMSGYCYGVCDSVENFLEVFDDELKNSPNQYFVCFSKVNKVDQPEYGGWRWHKWGPYIGSHTITTEYLFDEPLIDSVFLYQIYRKL